MINFTITERKDAEILRDISVKAFNDDLKKYGSLPPGIDTINWHTSKVGNGMYYKILVDDTIVGGMKLFDRGNNDFRLGAIFISPAYQNQGIGSKAIKFIETEYNHIKKWTLDTPYLNTRNHKFYEKHGYKKIDEIQPQKDVEFYLFIYQKELN